VTASDEPRQHHTTVNHDAMRPWSPFCDVCEKASDEPTEIEISAERTRQYNEHSQYASDEPRERMKLDVTMGAPKQGKPIPFDDEPREYCAKCGSTRHDATHCDAMPVLTDEPHGRQFAHFGGVEIDEPLATVLAAVLAEVARLEAEHDTSVTIQDACYVVSEGDAIGATGYANIAALAILEALRLKAGGAT